ncbi:MAG: ATP-binding protein [Firmicutes bacterium]|nr:ATP-binding protein [Bacillota bacterium]
MKIAVLSGKGGTGKTTVAASLAFALDACQYIDCDVEEPNGALFLKPALHETYQVKVRVPEVDPVKCNGCGNCARACQFHALAVIHAATGKNIVLTFSEICHHCGACLISCPTGAIHEAERVIGVVEADITGTFLHGRLNIGEPISIPVIRELKRRMDDHLPVILDCPPGASCSVAQSIEGCDYCILVTEPTPFGLHDLKIAAALVKKMEIPCGVVINKATDDQRMICARALEFCQKNGIELLLAIPFSREIAGNYSKGILPVQDNPEWIHRFQDIYFRVERRVKG